MPSGFRGTLTGIPRNVKGPVSQRAAMMPPNKAAMAHTPMRTLFKSSIVAYWVSYVELSGFEYCLRGKKSR